MNTEQAKAILQYYRPTVDAADPHFREALEQVQHDPDLAQWFTEHCASYAAIRHTLHQTPVPSGLRQAIFQAYARGRPAVWWPQPRRVVLALAAALGMAVIGYGVYAYRAAVMQPRDFTAYLQTMTSVAAGSYRLAIATADPGVLHRYLTTAQAPTDYTLPPSLRALRLEGGLVLEWFGHKVSMLCFGPQEATPQDQGEHDDHDVWFFVVNRAALPDAPASDTPRFASAHGLLTVSWSGGDKTYVLATRGALAQLAQPL